MSIQKSNFFAFKDEIMSKGTLKNSYFEVEFMLPPNHYLGSLSSARNLSSYTIRCDNASIPGVNLATIDGIPQYGYGAVETNPYSALFDPFQLVFTADKESEIYKFFFDWLNVIVKFDVERVGMESNSSGRQPYEVGYKNRYMCDLKVHVYKDTGIKSKTVKVFKAYPRAINQIDLDWSQSDSVMKIQIPFSYRDFKME